MTAPTKTRVPVPIVLAVQLAEQARVLREDGLDATPTATHADDLFAFARSAQTRNA